MAVPFGGHPRFAAYLAWAQSQGCEVRSMLVNGVPVTRIVAPSGKFVCEAMDQLEYMVPSTVWRLNRRLGLTSPFFAINPKTGETTGDP